MFYTYILVNEKGSKTYVGHTNDLERRLKEHNDGKSIFSRRYKPWRVLYKEAHKTEIEAIKREKYLKSAAGRRWIKKNIFK